MSNYIYRRSFIHVSLAIARRYKRASFSVVDKYLARSSRIRALDTFDSSVVKFVMRPGSRVAVVRGAVLITLSKGNAALFTHLSDNSDSVLTLPICDRGRECGAKKKTLNCSLI